MYGAQQTFPPEERRMTDPNPFVGTWKLISREVAEPGGKIRYLHGKDVAGYPVYTADGYMSAGIMDPDRQQSDPDYPPGQAAAETLPDPERAVKHG
jgi:hypothetical protein